jgi:hypothetical protein
MMWYNPFSFNAFMIQIGKSLSFSSNFITTI